MRAFRAGVPWQSTLHSWTLLDSHDSARFRTVAGSRERQLVGVGLQMTTPGVPMVFAGDELGLEGAVGRGRAPDDAVGRAERWDDGLLDGYRRADRAAALERTRSRAEGSATHTSATMRSRTCARRAVSGCSASPRAPPTSRSVSRSACARARDARRRRRALADGASCRRRPRVPRLEVEDVNG